jgi:hypothetical protein
VSCFDETVKIWNPETGELIRSIQADPDRREAYAYGGRHVRASTLPRALVFGPNGTVKVREIGKAEEEEKLLKHAESIHAWARHGDLLAAGTGDGRVLLWDAKEGRIRQTLTGHLRAVLTVAFDPTGKRLASGSEDATVKLWDVVSGREQETLYGHGGWVLSVAFDPKGKTLVSGGFDGMVRLWPLGGEDRVEEAVQKGLGYAVRSQQADGCWSALGFRMGANPERSPTSPRWPEAVMTGLNGLALLSSGSTTEGGVYRQELRKARDWLLAWFDEQLDDPALQRADMPGFVQEGVAFGGYFLGEVYRVERTSAIRKGLEKILKWVSAHRKEDGGWSYGERGGMTYLTNWFVSLLVMYQSLGLEVEPEVFEKLRRFYIDQQNEDGGHPYHAPPCYANAAAATSAHLDRHAPSDVGRSVGGLCAMYLLGMEGSLAYRKALAYARENWRTIGGAKEGPEWSLLFCGIALQTVDPGLFEGFWHSHRDDVLGKQEENGGFSDHHMFDHSHNLNYSTPLYVHLLRLPDRPLLLHRLSPVGKGK